MAPPAASFESIVDPDDPRLDDYRNVRDPEWIHRRDIFLAEGQLAVRKLLGRSRFRVRSLLATERALEGLREDLELRPVRVYQVQRPLIEQVAGASFHQGCVAVGELPCPSDPIEVLSAVRSPSAVLLVLERVADPDNVGGLFRNARAFGVAAVLLSPGCAHPLYRKAIRTSMGATLDLPFAELGVWPGELELLDRGGFTLIALTPRAEARDIRSLDPTQLALTRRAVLVGGEGQGLSEDALAASAMQVRIAMVPGVDSLNVAAAAGIALHRIAEGPHAP